MDKFVELLSFLQMKMAYFFQQPENTFIGEHSHTAVFLTNVYSSLGHTCSMKFPVSFCRSLLKAIHFIDFSG